MMLFVLLAAISVVSAQTITLTGTIRDFTPQTNPDFEYNAGYQSGLVKQDLGADNKPVFNGGTAINSQATFDQWYRDVSGVNIPMPITLTLNFDSSRGVYTYANDNFFPIDGQGFGDYAYGHNFHFTTEFATEFTYNGGETFNFAGDDDVWVFINRQLAIDLGGVHGPLSASVALDSLGLTAGQTYPLHIFQAERHTVGSTFHIDTTLVVRTQPTQVCGNHIVEGTEKCDGGSCCQSDCTFSNTVSCFCGRQNLGDGEMEYYCNNQGGFYQCLGGVFASQSRNMNCGRGTHCACGFGEACSCHLSQSPCVSASMTQTC